MNLFSNNEIHKKKKIVIKVSCDGTNLSRNVKVINIVFNIINKKIKAASSSGSYRIGIFKIDSEDYDSIKEWLPLVWNKIRSLTCIYYDKVDRKARINIDTFIDQSLDADRFIKINIEHCFSADYKIGMYSAKGNWPCIYCKQHKNSLHLKGLESAFF